VLYYVMDCYLISWQPIFLTCPPSFGVRMRSDDSYDREL